MEEVIDLFGDFDDNEDNIIPKNENYYIAETLKLIKDTNEYPLYIYCMLKTLLQKKDLLNDNQKKELCDLLGIKPVIKEVIKIKERIVYKERKPKANNYDDY